MAADRRSIFYLLNPTVEPGPKYSMLKSSPLGMHMLSSPVGEAEQSNAENLEILMYPHVFDASRTALPSFGEVLTATTDSYDPYDISDTFLTNNDSSQQADSPSNVDISGKAFTFNLKDMSTSSPVPLWPGSKWHSGHPAHRDSGIRLSIPKRKDE